MNLLLPVTRYFGVSVLAEEQTALSNHFAGREGEGTREWKPQVAEPK